MAVTPLWPVHPQILSGEILSSWMVRIAHANGLKPYTFYTHYLGRSRDIWTRDVDHLAPDWLTTMLSERTGSSCHSIRAATLRSYEGIAFERMTEVGATRWVLPLGVYHRTRRSFGQQYCPVCLATDAEPYLRLHWRLALSVICTAHGVMLQDRCTKCGRALAPHRADPVLVGGFRARAPIRFCGHCRADLAGSGEDASAEDVALQRHIETTVKDGYCVLGDAPVYSHLYFDGLRLLMLGLQRSDGSRLRFVFEHMGPIARLNKFRDAYALVDDWPRRFIEQCGCWRRAYSRFRVQGEPTPWWLWSVLRQNFYSAPAPMSVEESRAMLDATERAIGRRTTAAARKMFGRTVLSLTLREAVTEDQVDTIIAAIDHEISRTLGIKRNLLIRDKVMLLVARRERMTLTELASRMITRSDVGKGSIKPFWDNARRPGDVKKIIAWYLCNVRQNLCAGRDCDALFVSQTGTAMSPNAIGARYKRAVRAAGLRIGIWTAWSMP